MLRPGWRFAPRSVNVCSNYGGLGDMIARTTVFRYIRDNHPHITLNIYWHDYFVELAHLLLPESQTIKHYKMSELDSADKNLTLVDFKGTQINSLSMHLVEHAFLVIANRLPESPEDYIYPRYVDVRPVDHLNLPDDFVIVTPCFTSLTREWRGDSINETIKGLHEMGFNTVLMGKTESVDHGNGKKINGNIPETLDRSLATLDLIDKLTLRECLDVMMRAKCVIGVDNGLLHLSACAGTPSVWGFTSVIAQHRVPGGVHIEVVTPEAPCHGCQSRCVGIRWDFRVCPLIDTPVAYECITQMQPKKFLQSVQKIIDSRR